MLDLIIKNGVIIDGTGRSAFAGEVGVKDGKITAVKDKINEEAAKIIDAKGHYVTPGFVDMHRHADVKAFDEDFGEIELRQGITTVVGGQCGLSAVPLPAERKEEMLEFLKPIIGNLDPTVNYTTFAEYIAELKKRKMPLNYGCCIGNGVARMAVKGFENGAMSPEEVKAVQNVIRSSLEAGALGVTMGIVYAPEYNYDLNGFIEVLQPMKDFNVPLVTHIRGEGDIFLDSLREVVGVAKALGVHLHLSHFKCVGKPHWGTGVLDALAYLEEERKNGVEITFDAYPYTAGATQMIQYLPPDYLDGGSEEITKRLADPEKRKKLIEILEKPSDYFENLLLGSGWDKTIITTVNKKENEKYLGMYVTELAELQGKSPYDAAFDLLVDENSMVGMVNFTQSEDDMQLILSSDYCNVISDSLYTAGGLPHPRVYAAFPRYLMDFVRDHKRVPLERAINKMTRKPAEVYHLDSKGLIKEGKDADFAIFDLKNIDSKATYADSKHLATGFDYVIVNGEVAVQDDVWQKSKSGKILQGK